MSQISIAKGFNSAMILSIVATIHGLFEYLYVGKIQKYPDTLKYNRGVKM